MPQKYFSTLQSFQRYHGSSTMLDLCHEQIARMIHVKAEFCTVLSEMWQSIILMD